MTAAATEPLGMTAAATEPLGVVGVGFVVVVEVVEVGVGFEAGGFVGCAIAVDDVEDGVSSVVLSSMCVLGFMTRSFVFFLGGPDDCEGVGPDDCDGVVSSVCCSGGGGGGKLGGEKSHSLIVSMPC